MFSDTVSVIHGKKIFFDEQRNLNGKVFGDTHKFRSSNIYNPRISGAACPTPLAFKTNPLIKKIGSMV
jgi:hypothetical protein